MDHKTSFDKFIHIEIIVSMFFDHNGIKLETSSQKIYEKSLIIWIICIFKKYSIWGFPGGVVMKKPPARAVDTGSSPGLERSHMPQSN